jgi:hypothetical protein
MLRRVTYRDDRDADRARIESLEAELAAANKRVSELEHKESTALVRVSDGAVALTSTPSASKTWFGAPLEMVLEREFAGTFPTDKFEDLIEPIRTALRDSGRTEILKSSLTWTASAGPKSTGPFLVVTVSVRGGKTRLVVSDKLGQLAGAIFGGVGGGVGGGTIILPILAGAAIAPVAIPIALLAWAGGTWVGCRSLFKWRARKRAEGVQRMFDLLGEIIEAEIERPAT